MRVSNPLGITSNVFKFFSFGPHVEDVGLYGIKSPRRPSHYDKHSGVTAVRDLPPALNGDDNDACIYVYGGDYAGRSYHGTIRAWKPEVHMATGDPEAAWRTIYPYAGPIGTLQAKGPDTAVLVELPDGRIAHIASGMGAHSVSQVNIPGETLDTGLSNNTDPATAVGPTLLVGHNLIFDRIARRWTDAGKQPPIPGSTGYMGRDTWFAVIDEVSGRVLKLTSGAKFIAHAPLATLAPWTFLIPNNRSLGPVQKAHWAHDREGRRVFIVDPDRAILLKWDLESLQFVNLGPIPGGHINADGTRGYCFYQSDVHAVLVHRYNGARESWVYWPDDTPPRWMPLPHVNEGIPPTLPLSRQVVHYRGGCEYKSALALIAPGSDGLGPDGMFLLHINPSGTPIPQPPEEPDMMEPVRFEIPMSPSDYPVGTPQPTGIRVTAVGPVTRVQTAPWEPQPTSLITVNFEFDRLTEHGEYVSTVEMIAGNEVLATRGPGNFIIDPVPPPAVVVYNTPGAGFQVFVGAPQA